MSGSVDASRFLIPTLKDDPADAEAISHKLLVRGGFVRQLGSGLYTYLPLGWRVLQNAMGIIREEMDTIGLEMLMPVLQPAELWQATDRYDIDVLFKLEGSGEQALRARDHARGVRHLPRRPRDPLLPRAAADLVPPADEGARRAAAAGRDPAHARVHHEGLLQLRPRPGRARGVLRQAPRRLHAHLRALRPRGLRRSRPTSA